MKSEPESFGYDDLVRVKREGWDGVRNYQARNFMRAMVKGDEVIFYHSNANPPGVAGIAKVVKTAEPDPTQFDPASKYYDPDSNPHDPRWDWVTIAPVRAKVRGTCAVQNTSIVTLPPGATGAGSGTASTVASSGFPSSGATKCVSRDKSTD